MKIQSVSKECLNCELIQLVLKKEEVDIEKARFKCNHCRKIYKFDAIANEVKRYNNLKAGHGKTATLYKKYAKEVVSLHEDYGMSFVQIAKHLGINKNSACKIYHEYKENNGIKINF